MRAWLIATPVLLAALAPARAAAPPPPVTADDDGAPFHPPELIAPVPADYPAEAAAAGLEATVPLELTLDEAGAVTAVKVLAPAGHGFDEAATAAARRFRFRPARHGDRPISARIEYRTRFVLQHAPPPPTRPVAAAQISGLVLARGSRAPVAGAHVVLRGPTSAETETDGDGAFVASNLEAGSYQVTITGAKIVRAEVTERLAPRAHLTVHYYVDQPWSARFETTVRGSPQRVEVARTLTTAELTRIPGTFGDALRAVENLPGVSRAPFNTGLIIVRGGKPSDSRAFLSGAEVPQLYHFGGLTSVVPSQLVDQIEFYPGNFSARYGRSIAGAIDVDLRPGKTDRLHGFGETNAFDTGVGIEGPIGKGSFYLGGRRSYVDLLLTGAVSIGLLDGAGLSFTSAPVYYDYQAILDYPLWGGRVRAMIFGSDDDLRLVFNGPSDVDPSVRGAFETHIFFHRLQLRWTRSAGPWSFLVQSSTGYNGTDGALGPTLNFAVGALGSDWRLEARYRVSPRFQLLVGADTQASIVFLSALVPQPVGEGEQILPLAAATKYRAHETIKVGNAGLYVEGVLRPTSRLTITAGARFDYYSPIASVSVDPRLLARVQITPITALKLGAGFYSQDPQAQDFDPIFGNPHLRPERSLHLSASVEQGVWPGVMLEVTGFYKTLWDLVMPSTASLVGSDGSVVAERRVNSGEGRIYGGEVMLRQSLSKHFFGWISYTLMKSERRTTSASPWRLFDYDQTHVLVLALSANLPKGFGAGVRFRYVSGFPYTPAHGGEFDSDAAVYIPGAATVNSARLDAFHQLDLRVDKQFVFERWVLKIYLDVSNVYNRANPEQVQYSFDFKRQVPVTGLPLLPSFGIRGEF